VDAFYFTGSVINISLVVKGTIDGERRSLLFRPATSNYETDKTGVGPFTRAELVAKVLAGDTLTLMGVPTASGQRTGIDRNANSIPDGDETPPLLMTTRSDSAVLISWPAGTPGVVLEFSESLAPDSWKTETAIQNIDGERIGVSVPMTYQRRFYRLRRL
jgi:hypothetical protein